MNSLDRSQQSDTSKYFVFIIIIIINRFFIKAVFTDRFYSNRMTRRCVNNLDSAASWFDLSVRDGRKIWE